MASVLASYARIASLLLMLRSLIVGIRCGGLSAASAASYENVLPQEHAQSSISQCRCVLAMLSAFIPPSFSVNCSPYTLGNAFQAPVFAYVLA